MKADSSSAVHKEGEDKGESKVGQLVIFMRRGTATAASVPSDAQLLGYIG